MSVKKAWWLSLKTQFRFLREQSSSLVSIDLLLLDLCLFAAGEKIWRRNKLFSLKSIGLSMKLWKPHIPYVNINVILSVALWQYLHFFFFLHLSRRPNTVDSYIPKSCATGTPKTPCAKLSNTKDVLSPAWAITWTCIITGVHKLKCRSVHVTEKLTAAVRKLLCCHQITSR